MALPDRLNETPSGRFPSTPYAGPLYTPSEARAELRRRQQVEDQRAQIRRSAANEEAKLAADEFGIATQSPGGRTFPKLATDPSSGAQTIETEPQEITDVSGRQRKLDRFGRTEPIRQGPVQYLPGDSKTEGMADPSILYRVERAPEEIGQDGYDYGLRRPRKVEPVGRMDLLTDATNPEVQIAARQNMLKRNQAIFGDANKMLGEREKAAKNESEGLRVQKLELQNQFQLEDQTSPITGTDDAATLAFQARADARKKREDELDAKKLEADKRAVEFGRQRLSLEAMERDTAHIEALNRAVANVRARGEDPNKDPIVNALKESYTNLKMQVPDVEDPLYAGSIVSPTRGPMINPGEGSPEAAAMQERMGLSEAAKQNEVKTMADIKALVEERKRKAEPILQAATDRQTEFNVKRTTRDKLAERYNALIGSLDNASPEETADIYGRMDGIKRLVDTLDGDLKTREEEATKATAGAEAERQFANENAAMMEEAGKQKVAEGYRKANELISAQKKREEIVTPPAVDQRPALIDKEISSIPEEQLPQKQAELVQNGTLPPEAQKQSLSRNLLNQLVKGTVVANQRMMYAGLRYASAKLKTDPRMPTGIVDMILNPVDTGWMEEAAESAKRNAEWFDKTFPTTEAFDQSYVGGVAKGLSELPAQFAPYLATGGLGGVALGGMYNFSYLMDEAYQRYSGNPEFEKLNEVEKANFVANYAMPAAVLDTFADKVTLGMFGKLIGKPMRAGADVLRAGGYLAVSSVTEGGTEVAQDAYLQKLGEVYDLIPESELFTKETLKTFAIAATIGAVAPVAISGGRRIVLTTQGALDNRQQVKANQQAAELTSDVPRNGWAQWMDGQEKNYSPVMPEGQQLLGISARTSPLGSFAQLRGKVSNVLIEKGQDIDTQIALLEADTARPANRSLTQKAKDALTADARTQPLRQLHSLYMERAALASAAQAELKARDVVAREVEALPTASADGSYNPRASALAVAKFFVESPSLQEAELKMKMGKDPLFTKDMNGNTVPNQRFIDEVLPSLPAIQPYIERNKATAAELGTELAPERTQVPEPTPLAATPEQQMQRTTGDRLQGENPAERLTSFAKRIYDLNQKIVPNLGKNFQIKLELTDTQGGGYQTVPDPEGVKIILSRADFQRLEANPEENNRALNEELFHAADKLSAYVEADQQGQDRETYWSNRRTKMYSDLVEASKTDADILGALVASADIYFRGKQDILRGDLRDNPTGEGIVAAAEELDVPQWRLMSEFMRQYKTRRRLTEAKVEANAGKTQSLMAEITQYLKGIYRMLRNFTRGLNRNPELKASFEAEMKKIDDILNMPEGGPIAENQNQTPATGQPQTQPEGAQKGPQAKFAPDPTLGNRPDAVLALQALGYKKKEAEKMVSATDPALPSDEIVRSALGQTKKVGGVFRAADTREEPPAPAAPQTQQIPEGVPEGSFSRWYPNPQMQLPEDRLYNPPPERLAEESAAAIEAELGQREKVVKSPQGAEALRRQLVEQQKKSERNARRRARTAELKTQAEAQRLDATFTPQLRSAFVDLYDGPIREKLAAGAAFSALEPAEREEIIATLRDGAQSEGWLTQSRADLAQLAAETRSAADKQAFLDEAKRIEELQNAAKEFVATLPKQKQARTAAPAPAPRPQAETAPVEYRVFTQNHPDTIVVGGARIVDLSELQDMEGTEIQPRQRKQRAGYDQEVERIAMNLNPEQLMPGTATGDGAPVVLRASSNPYRTAASKLFDIISGHGRTKALRTAYEKYPEKANAYRETLLQKFPQFRQQIMSARMPAVVTEMHLGESVKASNTQGKTKATPKQFLRRLAVRTNPNLATEERAVADAREILDDPRLGMFRRETLIDDQGKALPGNEDVLSLWFDAFGRDGTLLNSNGTYKPEFERRVRLALLASTMGDQGVYSDFDLGIIGTIAEAEQSGIGQLTNSLMHAAPGLKALRAEAAQQFPDDAEAFDPMVPIAAGLQAFLQERNSAIAAGRNAPNWEDVVDNVRSQLQGLEGATLNETSIALFAPIAEFSKAKAPAKMKAYLAGLTNSVRTALNEYRETGGKDMFGNALPLAEGMNQTIIGMANRAADIARGGALQARSSYLGPNFEKRDDESGISWLRRVYSQYNDMTEDNDTYVTDRDIAEQTRVMLDTENLPGDTEQLETALQQYETAAVEDRMYYGMRSGEDEVYLDAFMKAFEAYLGANDTSLQARTSLPSDPDYLDRRPPEPTGEEVQPDLFGEAEAPQTRSSEFTPAMRDAYLHYFPTGETSAAVRALAKEFVNSDSISKGFTFEAFIDLVDDILIEVIPQAFRTAKTPMAYIDRAVKNNLRTRLTELQERFTSLDAPPDSVDAPPNEEGVTTAPAEIEVGGALDERRARVSQEQGIQDVEAPSTQSPEFMDKELSRDLYAVLDKLPKQIRDTFEGRILMGKTFKEIARERGLRQGGYQTIEKEFQAAQKLLGEYLTTLSPDGVRRFKEGVKTKAQDNEFGLQARTSPLGLDATHAKTGKSLDENVEKLISALGEDGGVFTLQNSLQSVTYSLRPSSLGWTAVPLRHTNLLDMDIPGYRRDVKVVSNNSLEDLLSSLPMIGTSLRSIKTLNRDSQRRAFKLGDAAGKFYSAAAAAIREKMPAQATRDQVEGILRSTPGVSANELRWLGVDDILNGMEQDGKINKEALLDAIVSEASSMFYAADANVDEYASWSSRGSLTRTAEITPLRRRGEQKPMAGTGLYAVETVAFRRNSTMEIPERDRMVHDAFKAEPGTRYIAHNRTDVLTSTSDKTDGLIIDELQQDAKADTPFGIVPLQKKLEIEGRRQGSPYLVMFKIALAKAVDTGKNWIGIPTGEAQSDRYDRGKYVDELRVLKYENPVQLFEDGSTAIGGPAPGDRSVGVGTIMYAVAGIRNGKPITGVRVPGAKKDGAIFRIRTSELPEVIGKELADKVIASSTPPAKFSSENDIINEVSAEFGAGPAAIVFKQPGLALGPAGLLRLYDRTIPQEINKYVSKWGGKLRPDSVSLGVDKQFAGPRPDAKQARATFLELGAILSGYQSLAEAVEDMKQGINNGQIMPSLIAEPERWITGWGMDYSADRFRPTHPGSGYRINRFLEFTEKAYGNRSFPYSYRKETIQNAIAELERPTSLPSEADPRAWRNVREAVDLTAFLDLRPRYNERTKEWQLVDKAGRPTDQDPSGLAASYLVSALDTMQLLREVLSHQEQIADAESVLREMTAQRELDERPQEHFENAKWSVKHFTKQIDSTLAQLDTTGAFLLGGVIEQAKPGPGVPIYRLDISPAMAEDVKAGQALFARLSGATQAETKQIGELFDEAKQDSIHRLFEPPAPSEVVRTEARVKNLITPKEADKVIQGWMDHAYKQGKASINGKNKNADKIVLSLFDYTGEWSKPWAEAGYQVYQFDTQLDEESGDVNNFSVDFFNNWFNQFDGQDVHAILAACPCTDFAVSGARHFAAKDADGRTLRSVQLVEQTLATIEYFKPAVWALENPVGRIEQLTGLPPWRMSFNPSNFGDPYTKKTLLWGRFNAELPLAPVEPTEGSKMWSKYGGKSKATKNARSVTPQGFAYAFFMANNHEDHRAMSLSGKYDRLNPRVFQMAEERGITDDEIKEAIDDFYYMNLDDKKAEQAILALAANRKPVRKPIERLEPKPRADGSYVDWEERTGLTRMTREEMDVVEPILDRIRAEVEVGKKGKEAVLAAALVRRLPKGAKAIFEKYIKVVGAEDGFPIDDGAEVVLRLISMVQQSRRGEQEEPAGKFMAEYPRELFPMDETAGRQAPAPEADIALPQEGEDSPGMEQMSLFARLSSALNEIEAGVVSTDPNERTAAYQAMSRTRGLSTGRGPYGRGETAYDRLNRFSDSALVPEALEIEFGFRVPQGAEPLSEIEVMRRRKAENVMNYYDLRRVMLKRNPALLREILRPAATTPGTPQYRKGKEMERFMMRATGSLRARTSLDLSRPESFEEVAEYLAKEFPIDNVPTLLAGIKNGAELGRGDLANPGLSNEVRNLVDAVDEARKETLTIRPDDAVGAAAQQYVNDPGFPARILRMAKEGKAATDSETAALRILLSQVSKEAFQNPDSKEGRDAAILVHAYRKLASEWGRTGRQLQDSILSPAQRHLEFLLTTVLTPRGRLIQRKRLKKALDSAPLQADKDAKINELITEIERLRSQPEMQLSEPDPSAMARLAQQVQRLEQQIAAGQQANSELVAQTESLRGDLAEARARARIIRGYRTKMDSMKQRIALLEAKLAETQAQATYEDILASDGREKMAQVDQALAKLGTSFAQLLAESDMVQLRTGKVAQQIFDSVKMSDEERKYAQLASLGYDPRSLKIRPERLAEIMKQLRAEADRRFKRFAETRPTQAQMDEFLRRMREEGGSLMARMDRDDGARLTPEQAMEQIYKALGHTIEYKSGKFQARDRQGKTNLFDLRKPEHAFVLASGIQKADTSYDSRVSELYTSLILSGIGTQLVNFANVPFSPVFTSIFRGLEVFKIYALQNAAKRKADDIGGTTQAAYRTLGDAASGAFNEIFHIWKGAMAGAIPALSFARLAWETEAGFFMSEMTGYGGPEDAIQKFGGKEIRNRRSIPGKVGRIARIPLRALTAADEFNKAWRSYMNVGATAYRMGKEMGLGGQELENFIAGEINNPQTASWRLAGQRAERETFTRDLPDTKAKGARGFGDLIGIFPGLLQRLNMFMAGRREAAYEEGGALGIAERAVWTFLSTFNMFLKTTYNILREGLAYAPLPLTAINLVYRYAKARQAAREAGDPSGTMSQEDYDMLIMRTAQTIPLTLLLSVLHGAFEGDDDDDEKLFLITGSADKRPGAGWKTRLGNVPYSVRIGPKNDTRTIADYSRIEPLATGLGVTADIARAWKEGGKSDLAIISAVRFAQDLVQSPLDKTFGKSRKDLTKMLSTRQDTWQGWSVLRDRLQAFTSPPIVRKFLTAPDDIIRDAETEPFSERGVMDMLMPRSEPWRAAGLLGPTEDILPPKRDVDGAIRRKTGTPAARALIPGQAIYAEQPKRPLELFISAYNTRFPDDRWNPEPPSRAITDPVTGKKIYLTTQQYAQMRTLAAGALQQRLGTAITSGDLKNPSREKRQELSNIISDVNSQARKIIAVQVLRGRIEQLKAGAEAGPR